MLNISRPLTTADDEEAVAPRRQRRRSHPSGPRRWGETWGVNWFYEVYQ